MYNPNFCYLVYIASISGAVICLRVIFVQGQFFHFLAFVVMTAIALYSDALKMLITFRHLVYREGQVLPMVV